MRLAGTTTSEWAAQPFTIINIVSLYLISVPALSILCKMLFVLAQERQKPGEPGAEASTLQYEDHLVWETTLGHGHGQSAGAWLWKNGGNQLCYYCVHVKLHLY